jgi:hypothetical protein
VKGTDPTKDLTVLLRKNRKDNDDVSPTWTKFLVVSFCDVEEFYGDARPFSREGELRVCSLSATEIAGSAILLGSGTLGSTAKGVSNGSGDPLGDGCPLVALVRNDASSGRERARRALLWPRLRRSIPE